MQVGSQLAADRSLTPRLARAFMAVALLIIATLVVTGACFVAVLGHFEPSVNTLLAGRDAVDEVQNGMLDDETGFADTSTAVTRRSSPRTTRVRQRSSPATTRR